MLSVGSDSETSAGNAAKLFCVKLLLDWGVVGQSSRFDGPVASGIRTHDLRTGLLRGRPRFQSKRNVFFVTSSDALVTSSF